MLLPPGVYLAEVNIARPITTEALLGGLQAMGWSDVAVDRESVPKAPSPGTLRFVGRLSRPIVTQNTTYLEWSHLSPVPFDVFGGMRLLVHPFRLTEGTPYALWFVTRMRAHEKRADVLATLEKEGFRPLKLSELKNNTRLPGRPGASVSFWYAIGVWSRPSNYVNTEYPFYFENVQEIAPT